MFKHIQHDNPVELLICLKTVIKQTNMYLVGECAVRINNTVICLDTRHLSELDEVREKQTISATHVQDLARVCIPILCLPTAKQS